MYDVKTIVQSITQGARNELEKLRAIWVWLCHNIGEINELYIIAFDKLVPYLCLIADIICRPDF